MTSPTRVPATVDRMTWAVDQLELLPASRVLDVGWGLGRALILVCELVAAGAGHVTAVDRSPRMVAAAGRRNPSSVSP